MIQFIELLIALQIRSLDAKLSSLKRGRRTMGENVWLAKMGILLIEISLINSLVFTVYHRFHERVSWPPSAFEQLTEHCGPLGLLLLITGTVQSGGAVPGISIWTQLQAFLGGVGTACTVFDSYLLDPTGHKTVRKITSEIEIYATVYALIAGILIVILHPLASWEAIKNLPSLLGQ